MRRQLMTPSDRASQAAATRPIGRASRLSGAVQRLTSARRLWQAGRVSANSRQAGSPPYAAFTLLELLIVLAILGLLATLSLPAIKHIRQSNTMVAAGRQLVDDLSLARARAVAERTTVHVVFVPPDIAHF